MLTMRDLARWSLARSSVARRTAVLGAAALTVTLFLASFAAPTAPVAAAQDANAGLPALAEITGDSVNLRAGASTNHFAYSRLGAGTRVVLVERRGDWYGMVPPSDVKCWIHSRYVESAGAGRFTVHGNKVNLRVRPEPRYTVIGQVEAGTLLEATGARSDDGEWIEIRSPLAARGYMHSDYIRVIRRIQASEIDTVRRSFSRIEPAVARGMGDDSTEDPKVIAKRARELSRPELPRVVSDRLRQIHSSLSQVVAEDPRAWKFDSILRELRNVIATSEDAGETQLARVWDRHIRDNYLPVVEEIRTAEERMRLARARREASEEKEKDTARAIPPIPDAPGASIAKGWVLPKGDREIGATHRLMKGNKLLYYLRSDTIDLNSLAYKRADLQGRLEDAPNRAGVRVIVVTAADVLSH